MIEAKVGYDPIYPCIKRTFETKTGEIDIGAEKCFLVDILTIFRRAGQVNGKTQNCAIVLPHKLFKCRSISLLGLANESGVVHALLGNGNCRPVCRDKSNRIGGHRKAADFAGL